MTDNNTENCKHSASRPRPLSPHLQVYKPQLTSLLSIMHRGTGVFLYVNIFLFALFLYSYAFWDKNLYECINDQDSVSLLFEVYAFFVLFALCFHFCTGIRHLFWDMGKGYDIERAYFSGKLALVSSVILSIIAYILIF